MADTQNFMPQQLDVLGLGNPSARQFDHNGFGEDRSVAGWWLVPSILMGASMWIWLLSLVLG